MNWFNYLSNLNKNYENYKLKEQINHNFSSVKKALYITLRRETPWYLPVKMPKLGEIYNHRYVWVPDYGFYISGYCDIPKYLLGPWLFNNDLEPSIKGHKDINGRGEFYIWSVSDLIENIREVKDL